MSFAPVDNLLGLYLFGSEARGDSDELSDLDLLAVVRNNSGKIDAGTIVHMLPLELRDRDAAISWYGFNRLSRMFDDGDLFAWHLFHEAKPIYESRLVFDELGRPNPYRQSLSDIDSFIAILDELSQILEEQEFNIVYEFGLIYVCLRNIAISASWILNDRPDFSRHSPYRLAEPVPDCPVSLAAYTLAMKCRMASQRGLPPPAVEAGLVRQVAGGLIDWTARIRDVVAAEVRQNG